MLNTIRKAITEDRSGSITVEILIKLNMTINGLPIAELASVAAWFLWWQRRQLVMMIQSPKKTTLSIRVLATNYIRSPTAKMPTRLTYHMWRKPPHSTVKVNADASFQADTLSGASGAVVRDDKGDFIAAASWFMLGLNLSTSLLLPLAAVSHNSRKKYRNTRSLVSCCFTQPKLFFFSLFTCSEINMLYHT